MTTKTAKEAEELVKSEEMQNLYHVLAVKHSNAITRVMRGENAEDIKQLAKDETNRLIKSELPNHKCRPGTIWDETIGRCVPI